MSLSESIVWANDVFLKACAQLTNLRSLDVHLSPTLNSSSIRDLLAKKPILTSNFCLEGLRRLHHDSGSESACAYCLVKLKKRVRRNGRSHQKGCSNVQSRLLDLFEWPQAIEHGFCSSCFLPLQLCGTRADGSPASPCTYRTVMRKLLVFSSPKMDGWRIITATGEPTYWSFLLPLLLEACGSQSSE